MTARRPSVGIPGTPNYLGELQNGDSLVVEQLADRNGAASLDLPPVTGAVNRSILTPSIAGSRILRGAAGSDTDIDLDDVPKGAGLHRSGSSPVLTLERVVRRFVKDPALGTFQNVGFPAAPNLRGFSVANGDDTPRPLATFTTTATTAGVAGLETAAFNYARRSYDNAIAFPFRTSFSIAVCRLWVGFRSATLDTLSSPQSLHVASFRYATDVDGTAFWRCYTSNGVGETITTTTAAIATGTNYRLAIELRKTPQDQVLFWIDGVLVAVHTSTLPGNTTSLGFGATIETLENVAKSLRCGTVSLIGNG